MPIDTYRDLAVSFGLQNIRTEDWSKEVQPFWRAVIETALTPRGILGLFRSGMGTMRGALVMPLMQQGLRRCVLHAPGCLLCVLTPSWLARLILRGLIRFNLLTATRK